MQLQLPKITEVRGIRVLTTRQIAEAMEQIQEQSSIIFDTIKNVTF